MALSNFPALNPERTIVRDTQKLGDEVCAVNHCFSRITLGRLPFLSQEESLRKQYGRSVWEFSSLLPTEAHGWSPDFLSSVMMTPAEEPVPLRHVFLFWNPTIQNFIMCKQNRVWSISRKFLSVFVY